MRLTKQIRKIYDRAIFALNNKTKPDMNETGKTAYGVLSQTDQHYGLVQDDLTARKGSAIYAEMKQDPDVKNALVVKSCGVLSKGWEINAGDESAQAQEQADFVQTIFDDMPGSFDDVLMEIIKDGLCLGTSLSEKNWLLRDDGKFGIKSIKVKDPNGYDITQDEYGNITDLFMTLLGQKLPLDINKFCIFTWQSEHGNPWGTSDLRAAYRYYWLKKMIVQWYAVYLEKYSMPTPIGKVKRGTNNTIKQALLNVISKIQQETALVINDDETVELLSANNNSSNAGIFNEALDMCNKQIAKAILGQTLATGEGTRTGSYAQSKVHQDVMDLYIKNLKRQIEEFVDENIVRDIINYNFATPVYPNFTLLLDDRDIKELSETFFRLTQAEIVDPRETWIREYMGLPEKEELPEIAIEQPLPIQSENPNQNIESEVK